MKKTSQQSLWEEEANPLLKRSQVQPLHLPEDIYTVLSGLQIGQQVPAQVLIYDLNDGSIPSWEVAEIEQAGGLLLIMTVVDRSATWQPLGLPVCFVATDVFTLPTKTLAGLIYGYYPGCEHARNMLADIRQYARQIVDRQLKKKARRL